MADTGLKTIAARIRLLVLDVDAAATQLHFDAEGREFKSHVRDGYGIRQVMAAGIDAR